MPQEKYLKFTYNGPQKVNAYLKMPSPTFAVLYREIAMCLFNERKLPECELKAYWIDEDGDDIEIVNQNDYEIFMSKRSERQHLQVGPRNLEKIKNNGSNNATAPLSADDDPTNFIIHDRVECDACEVGPIIGFRYKCIECPNYDLCQRCEAQHKHPEHMMVRMPGPNSPSVIEAWVSSGGRCARRASKRAGKSAAAACPFANLTPYGSNLAGAQAAATDHHNRHERKHHRRQVRNGIFSNLYDMMQDLAEGGAANRSEENTAEGAGATAGASVTTTANANVKAQVQNAVNEAVNASEIAAKAAAAAAKRAMGAAGQAAGSAEFTFPSTPSAPAAEILNNCEPMEEAQTFIKVKPVAATTLKTNAPNTKTPPPTPDTTAPNFSAAPKATKETNTNNEGASIPVTPTLESLAQFVDPMYMKAGIQILNNFSEMFAKMLDPADGGDGGSCPFQMDLNQTRKSSTTSNASKTSSTTSSANTKTTSVENNVNVKKDEEVASTSGTAIFTTTAVDAPILEPTVVAPVETSQRRRRSQSDDNDWQLIEKQFENSSADISTASTLESFDLGAVGGDRNANGVSSMDINFEQLSKDLREHVANEKKREERDQVNENVIAAAVETGTIDAATAAVETVTIDAATAVVPAGTTAAPEPIKTDEGKRYHADDLINGAVHAMMAMGFSNEGAWLTQLLETVNGNISEALDLMNAAQRHNNNNNNK